MARIRSVKPELAQDAKLASVSREARYHFVLLWTVADDEGFFRANARSLLGQIYPHDATVSEADITRMNAALENIGVLEVRESEDGPIGCVVNWKKHQRIDRPSKSFLRETFAQHSRNIREGSAHGVLSPESRALSPDQDATAADAREHSDVSVPPDPELTALYLAICANKAVTERWGEQPNPFTTGGAAALYQSLNAAGVPPEVARLSLYRQCRESVADRPPRAINYFRPGILDDWEAEQARQATAASAIQAPAESEGYRRPPASGGARPPKAPAGTGRATIMLGEIRKLARVTQQPGQAERRFIPRTEVEKLGADVLEAYEAVGGAERILSTTGEKMSFLIRDFTQALESTGAVHVHV